MTANTTTRMLLLLVISLTVHVIVIAVIEIEFAQVSEKPLVTRLRLQIRPAEKPTLTVPASKKVRRIEKQKPARRTDNNYRTSPVKEKRTTSATRLIAESVAYVRQQAGREEPVFDKRTKTRETRRKPQDSPFISINKRNLEEARTVNGNLLVRVPGLAGGYNCFVVRREELLNSLDLDKWMMTRC